MTLKILIFGVVIREILFSIEVQTMSTNIIIFLSLCPYSCRHKFLVVGFVLEESPRDLFHTQITTKVQALLALTHTCVCWALKCWQFTSFSLVWPFFVHGVSLWSKLPLAMGFSFPLSSSHSFLQSKSFYELACLTYFIFFFIGPF